MNYTWYWRIPEYISTVVLHLIRFLFKINMRNHVTTFNHSNEALFGKCIVFTKLKRIMYNIIYVMWIVNIARRWKVRQIHWIDYNKEKRFLNGILTFILNSSVAFYMRFSVMCKIFLMFIAYLKRKYLWKTNSDMFLMPKF